MKRLGSRIILMAGVMGLSLAGATKAADEAELLAVLDSSVGAKERCEACRGL